MAAEAGVSQAEAATMTVAELATAKINREARGQDRRMVVDGGEVDGGAGRAQIIASIGLDPEVGRSMTLHEIYLEKFVRESDQN